MPSLMPLLHEVVVGGGPAPVYEITGNIVDDNTDPVSGATVTLTGDASDSTTTDGSGDYEFLLLPDGSYTVTPTKTDETFTPASRNVTVSGSSQTADFEQDAATFAAFEVNFIDMTDGELPTNGEVTDPTHPTPTVSTILVQSIDNKELSGGYNRTLLIAGDDANSPSYTWDVRDFGNGLDLPPDGFKIQAYVTTKPSGDTREFGLHVSATKINGTLIATVEDDNDGLFWAHTGSASDSTSKFGYRTENTTVKTIDQTDSPSGKGTWWYRYHLQYTASGKTGDMSWFKISDSSTDPIPQQTVVPTIENMRYITFVRWPNGYGQDLILHSFWVGNITDDWPANRTLV